MCACAGGLVQYLRSWNPLCGEETPVAWLPRGSPWPGGQEAAVRAPGMPVTVPQWVVRHLLAAAAPTSRRGRAKGVPRDIRVATPFPAGLPGSL